MECRRNGVWTKMKNLSRTIWVFLFQLSIAAIILLSLLLSIPSLSIPSESIPSESICLSRPAPDWTPISGNQYNMIAFGHIHIYGVDPGQGRLVLYGFGQKGERDCRFKCNIGPDGAYYATIRGNSRGEVISFKVYDWNNGKTYDLKDTITFEIDAVEENVDIR